jgi:O-antigen ligase
MTARADSVSPHQLNGRSGISRKGLFLLIWLLPFHILLMAVLFGFLHLPEGLVRSLAAWKEMAVIVLLLATVLRALAGRGADVTVVWQDLVVGGLVCLGLLFLVTEDIWFRANIPAGAQWYGLRDLVFFMLLYFVGRSTPEIVGDERVLRAMYIVGLITSIAAILERVLVTPDMLVLMGVASYFQGFLGEAAFTAGNDYGLPQAYWTVIGGVAVRRTGSVYLSSQAFAISFLLLMPAATLWAFGRKSKSAIVIAGYLLIWVGLFFSLTRMTIVVCALQVALYMLLSRRATSAVGVVAICAVAFAAIAAVFPPLLNFVWQTLTWQSASSESHLNEWWKGALAFLEHPWGSGLGTTDAAAVRFGLTPLTGDNQYLKYAVELGLPGLLLHLAAFFGISSACWRLYRKASDAPSRSFGLMMLLVTTGIMINAWTAVVFNSMLLAYVYFLLGGVSVTASERLSPQSTIG